MQVLGKYLSRAVLHRVLLAGGNWDNSSYCSSRCRNANNSLSNTNVNNGARGRIRSNLFWITPAEMFIHVARAPTNGNDVGKTQKRRWSWTSSPNNESLALVIKEKVKMVKRIGNLWDKVVAEDNIRLSYEQARAGKGRKKNVRNFNRNIDENLKNIRQSLIDKTFHTARYSTKTVYEPKKRTIYILPFKPDRIVQHAVMNIIIPIWEKLFIEESYACREGKGMHKGSLKTMEYIRANKYCLKCDISKFYPSINHAILKQIIRRKIKDKNVLWLLDDIIDSFEGETNTPIGNFTSQWFGNLYMNELDQYVRHTLKFKCYLRYCDDFCFFHNDKKVLNEVADKIRKFTAEKLKLRLSKCDLFPVSRGVDFLGYRHFPDYILLRKSTAKRAKRRLKSLVERLKARQITAEQFRSTVASYDGWMRWARTHNLRLKLDIDKLIEASRDARTASYILARL